jgi:predicted DNA-binding ribbon-helix-helix protein
VGNVLVNRQRKADAFESCAVRRNPLPPSLGAPVVGSLSPLASSNLTMPGAAFAPLGMIANDRNQLQACSRPVPRLHSNHLNAIGIASMALTNAEKQARYRERHLGVDGEKARVQLFLSADTKAQLDRLAHRKGCTVTALIEELAASAERRVTARLSGKARRRYYESE